ncbi:FAST kinase domain-containing protein 4 [Aplysia californica]|uniref:FAST kinase domain-containing protein 4 n=1 Tax=Aplysia californica TaxID=6500 RepID=A0ABM1A937_APLCA|nr:FAST kinase domain-containing protein 4 [Aplysia californica]
MSTFRAAVRLRPTGWTRAFRSNRDHDHLLHYPAVSNGQGFQLLVKNATLIKNGMCTSSVRPCSSQGVSDSSGSGSGPSSASGTVTSDSEPNVFDELFPSVNLSPRFVKDAEYRLYEWGRQVKEEQNRSQVVDLSAIVSQNFSSVVDFSLSVASPPHFRHRCLLILLSQPDDLEATERLLSQTVREAVTLPLKVVADVVLALSSAASTPLRDKARRDLVQAVVNKRWYEVGPRHAVFFMYQLDDLFDMRRVSSQLRLRHKTTAFPNTRNKAQGQSAPPDAKSAEESAEEGQASAAAGGEEEAIPILSMNLEARAITLADQLKVKDLSRVVVLMGKWRSRNEPLLNAVLHRLTQADLSEFSFAQLSNLLFACSVLRLHNSAFLSKLSAQLCECPAPSAAAACSVVTSLSHLRWRDLQLIGQILNDMADKLDHMTAREAINLVVSLGNLYPAPLSDSQARTLTDLSSKLLPGESNPSDRVSVVHSLAVLRLLNPELAASIFDPDFVQQLKGSEDFSQSASLQKLRSVNMAAKLEVKDYSGPLLSDSDLTIPEEQNQQTTTDGSLNAALLNALGKYADLMTYVRPGVEVAAGLSIDAVMCATCDGEVRPLSALDTPDSAESLHRLALVLVPFSAVLSPDHLPVGGHQLSARLLAHQGYVPVHILYSDLRQSQTAVEQVNNIRRRIVEAVATAMQKQQSPDPS